MPHEVLEVIRGARWPWAPCALSAQTRLAGDHRAKADTSPFLKEGAESGTAPLLTCLVTHDQLPGALTQHARAPFERSDMQREHVARLGSPHVPKQQDHPPTARRAPLERISLPHRPQPAMNRRARGACAVHAGAQCRNRCDPSAREAPTANRSGTPPSSSPPAHSAAAARNHTALRCSVQWPWKDAHGASSAWRGPLAAPRNRGASRSTPHAPCGAPAARGPATQVAPRHPPPAAPHGRGAAAWQEKPCGSPPSSLRCGDVLRGCPSTCAATGSYFEGPKARLQTTSPVRTLSLAARRATSFPRARGRATSLSGGARLHAVGLARRSRRPLQLRSRRCRPNGRH